MATTRLQQRTKVVRRMDRLAITWLLSQLIQHLNVEQQITKVIVERQHSIVTTAVFFCYVFLSKSFHLILE
jgi:hypothetical protein